MRKLYTLLSVIVAIHAIAADAPKRPIVGNSIASKTHVKGAASLRSRATEIWCPAVETQYYYEDGAWLQDLTLRNTYDVKGRVIKTIETNDLDETSVTVLEYDQHDNVIKRTKSTLDGDELTPYEITTYTYDPVVTDFQTSMISQTWTGSDWMENGQKRPVTRNEQGNVTAVEIYVPFNGTYDLTEERVITYNGNTADTYTHKHLDYDGTDFFWQTGTEARNIQWENTDGQIVGEFPELLIGANRVRRAEMYFEGEPDGYRIVSYPTPGKPDFVAIETGFDETEIYERHTYVETDDNGSFVEEFEYPFDGYSSKLIGTYDDKGNPKLIEEYETEADETFIVTGEKYEYSYDPETGNLLEVIFYGLDPDSENAEYIPYYKSVYSEFIDAAANPDIAISDTDAPVRYFNLQGIETANPVPGNIYIRVQGKNVTKTIMK